MMLMEAESLSTKVYVPVQRSGPSITVRELIQDTLWIPGFCYNVKQTPMLSILLPTYCRAKSGLFQKAVESCLSQSLNDIELIIVDDASTDGTAELIAELMQRDGRVSCLRHAYNIGLPAVSIYEAYKKSRGRFICYAFDDSVVFPDAYEQLLKQSLRYPNSLCCGKVILHDTQNRVVLGPDLSNVDIRITNLIPNSAVLVPRSIVEELGLSDPHIILSRVNDWDLWRRVNEHYPLQYVDVLVADEFGPATSDSLGLTYPYDTWAAAERMYFDNSKLIKPSDYEDIDVFSSDYSNIQRNKEVIHELSMRHIQSRSWPMKAELLSSSSSKSCPPALGKQILVLTDDNSGASEALSFGYLPSHFPHHIRLVSSSIFGLETLVHASCLIVLRRINRHAHWIAVAKCMQIPIYYCTDDNFTVLTEENVLIPGENFGLAALRDNLADFAGCLTSSQKIAEYFSDNLLHPHVYYFPPTYCGNELKGLTKQHSYDLCVAFMGGEHRHASFINETVVALEVLAKRKCSIHVLVGGVQSPENFLRYQTDYLKFTVLPFDINWKRMILKFAEYKPDILVHPSSKTLNQKYKTLNPLLNACLLNAILLAPDCYPYNQPEVLGTSVLVNERKGAKAYLDVFEHLLVDRSAWGAYLKANKAYCKTHFSGEQSIQVLEKIVSTLPILTPFIIEQRYNKLITWQRTASVAVQPSNELNSVQESNRVDAIKISLLELSQIRGLVRKIQRLRFWRPMDDMWPLILPNFPMLTRQEQFNQLHQQGFKLEFSPSLSSHVVEYRMPTQQAWPQKISCAFASEGLFEGQIILEIRSSQGQLIFKKEKNLSVHDIQSPVSFLLDGSMGVLESWGSWSLRLTASSDYPIYLFQFVKYTWFNRRKRLEPFILVE